MTTPKRGRKKIIESDGLGKIPPQDQDVECAVLGGILLAPNDAEKVISEMNENMFFNMKHSAIARAIKSLYKKNKPIDLLTTSMELKALGLLEEAGGAQYMSGLTTRVGSIAHIEVHFRILQEQALKRTLIQITSQTTRDCFDDEQDVFDVYARTQQQLDEAIKEVITYEVEAVGVIHERKLKQSFEVLKTGVKPGVMTGLRLLDNTTNGWQKTDFIVLAARPSMGKTACAVSMIVEPCIENKEPVAIFSLEMSKEQLTSRIESTLAQINVSTIVKNQCTEQELERIANACKKLADAPLFIDDTPAISILELKAKARKLKKEQDIRLLIVDYLQLMTAGGKYGMTREQEIAEISRSLKALAKELNIPIIALSQLSRSVEQRGGDKKPMLSDLRESGQIEQDADLVAFCYRPAYYGLEEYFLGNDVVTGPEIQQLFILIVAKHRNGELGEIPLKFVGEYTKITNREYLSNNNSWSTVGDSFKNCTFEQNNDSVVDFNKPNPMSPNTSFEKSPNSEQNDNFELGEDTPF